MEYYAFFFFNDTATTEIYTLSLHDALPIWAAGQPGDVDHVRGDAGDAAPRPVVRDHREVQGDDPLHGAHGDPDRKSTRLNSSHANISYAVFCLKKKNTLAIFLCIRQTDPLN